MYKNKVLLIPALVLTMIFQACISNQVASTPTPTTVLTPTTTLPAGRSQDNPLPDGSDINVEDMKFVITGEIRPADGIVAAGDMFNAQAGTYQQYIFVTLAVKCETMTDQTCHLSPFRFKLIGSDGITKYPERLISGVDGIMIDTDIQNGKTISANIPFIISIGDSRLQLVYDSLISGGSYYLALP